MAWKKVISGEHLKELIDASEQSPVVIFKHSPRCPISSLALSRFDSTFQSMDYYLLDVVSQRDLSQNVAASLGVTHESPQLLVLSKKQCIHHSSHLGISSKEVELAIRQLENN
ncbi:MAG: bacillithiol system redox-active protein YtxJ [Cyclobacteriaceae bacterium]|nr:bacillithiol system redox-active protein YtxJ [Cyclobacteriaceae bacterium]